jgi:hypothetical protein
MKRLLVIALVGVFSLPSSLRAETYSFTPSSGCKFKGETTDINDRGCKVTNTSDATQQWISTRIEWSDGVATQIEIQTVNRRSNDRTSSRYGLATIDGENAEYTTFSDGGICFTIESNRNTICYR